MSGATAFAASEFLRSMLIILAAAPLILLCVAAVVDVIDQHYTGWAIVGWFAVILVLPIIGPLIYFARRKPTPIWTEQGAGP